MYLITLFRNKIHKSHNFAREARTHWEGTSIPSHIPRSFDTYMTVKSEDVL